jgi:hypothetical protein
MRYVLIEISTFRLGVGGSSRIHFCAYSLVMLLYSMLIMLVPFTRDDRGYPPLYSIHIIFGTQLLVIQTLLLQFFFVGSLSFFFLAFAKKVGNWPA